MGKGIGSSGYKGVRHDNGLWKAVLPDETVLGKFENPLDAAIVRERFLHEHREEFINPERYLNGVDLAPGVTIKPYKKPKEYVYRHTRTKRYFVKFGKYHSRSFLTRYEATKHRDQYLQSISQ
ncbi:hypothetical protein [Nostoc phage YongM]|nr:hypothetical protein [Nostoc phage YongM]